MAWASGPPYCRWRELTEAAELLDRLGAAGPRLPTVDPGTVKIPYEKEIRALIELVSRPGQPGHEPTV